jgi:hypothetical protein
VFTDYNRIKENGKVSFFFNVWTGFMHAANGGGFTLYEFGTLFLNLKENLKLFTPVIHFCGYETLRVFKFITFYNRLT